MGDLKMFFKQVTDCAVDVLQKKNKPLSEKALIKSLCAELKRKYGKDDKRYSSKNRFKSDTLRGLIRSKEWKTSISLINDGKYCLSSWLKDLPENEVNSDYDWVNVGLDEAKDKTLNLLKKLDPFEFEELVKMLIEAKYPGFDAQTTTKTADMGIDVRAYRDSDIQKDKRQALFAQAKCYKGTVGRPDADKFIGAVKEFHISENWESFYALFVTTGKLPKSFRDKLKNSEESGVSFISWDGSELVDIIFGLGWGISYSINTSFWDKLDSKLIPKEIMIK